jgi:hypothetical protein
MEGITSTYAHATPVHGNPHMSFDSAVPSFDPTTASPAVQRILAPGTPPAVRQMAAKGVAPGLKPAEVAVVVAVLAAQGDDAIAHTAQATLGALPAPILAGVLASDLDPWLVGAILGANIGNDSVVEALVRMPRIDTSDLERAAASASERVAELIATNEARLLASPSVIVKLYKNPRTRMSTADRLVDLAHRNGVELDLPAFREMVEALQDQLLPEPTEERGFDDLTFVEAAQHAENIASAFDVATEDTHELGDDGAEKPADKVLPLYAALAEMSLSGKIRRATIGSAAERMILVRDTNKLVARAAIRSEMVQDAEVVRISASRQISSDILTIIAKKAEWVKNGSVKLNLVSNPKTPLPIASKLVPYLQEHEVRNLARSKSVPAAVQGLARQQLLRKKK